MARIRTIKPDFFTNEDLVELSPFHRLLFIGLWTQADREGRLKDRSKRLKAMLLPYDDCNIDQLLSDLADHGFVVRYEIEGERFLSIPTFTKHQRPHPKEPVSEIPPPIPYREKKRQAVEKKGETMSGPSLREGVSLREGKEILSGKPDYVSSSPIVEEIIRRLNDLSGKHYRPNSKTITQNLRAQLKEGFTEADFLLVVDDRWRRWKNNPEMRQHFNPDTLFRPAKFEKYLTEAKDANGRGGEQTGGGFVG